MAQSLARLWTHLIFSTKLGSRRLSVAIPSFGGKAGTEPSPSVSRMLSRLSVM